jgi:hypothetical protein
MSRDMTSFGLTSVGLEYLAWRIRPCGSLTTRYATGYWVSDQFRRTRGLVNIG